MPNFPKSPPLSELTPRQIQWIFGGYAMTFATMPGQTIFIAQFNSAIRAHFGLSHGEFGGLYTIATLASAFCLVWAGGLADRFAPRPLALTSIIGLGLVAIAMATQNHIITLVLTLGALRFFGQGMLSHIAMTTMSRWFHRFRGRAISLAGLGTATGDALTPFMITLAIATFGWRQVWFGTALTLILLIAPVIWLLMRDPPDGKKALARGLVNPDAEASGKRTGAQWTRTRVLRDGLFFMIIPGIMAPPAIGTLYMFHQAHLVELKGWDLTVFTASYPILALTVVLTALLAGHLVDRFGAWRLMPYFLLPQGIGCLVIGLVEPQWSIPVFLVCFGLTGGLMSPVVGALWAEIYGTTHLGTIRALATAALVAASAVGPGIAGALIDTGVDLDRQSFGYAAYCFAGAGLFLALRARFKNRVAESGAV
ncbi:MAG: MFS transporter [Devosia sp.]